MNNEIKEALSNLSVNFYRKYESFAFKTDLGAIKEFEYEHYGKELSQKIVPMLLKEKETHQDFNLLPYLRYVIEGYRQKLKQEIDDFNYALTKRYQKIGEDLVKSYEAQVLKKLSCSEQEFEGFIFDFCKENLPILILIAENCPNTLLDILLKIRTPKLQLSLVLVSEIKDSLCKYIKSNLIKEQYSNWVPKYFTYPRMEIESFLNKKTTTGKLHIKLCKNLFGEHYESIKIWLKAYEKSQEGLLK